MTKSVMFIIIFSLWTISNAQVCSVPATLPNNSQIVSGCTTTDPLNSNCTLACDSGYYASSGSLSTECLVAGFYSLDLVCSEITCATGILPLNTHVSFGCGLLGDLFGSLCVLACDLGFYQTSGSTTQTCNLNTPGSYTLNLGCSAVLCSTPLLPSGSEVVSGCTNADPFGSNCTLACQQGYQQTGGSSTVLCNLLQPLTYVLDLVCQIVTCAESNILPLGAEIVSGCSLADPYNSSCILKCGNGFSYVSGSTSRVCNSLTSGIYAASDLICAVFTPKNITGTYTNGWTITNLGTQFLAISSDGITSYLGSFTNDSTHVEIYVNGTTATGIINLNAAGIAVNISWSSSSLGVWVSGLPIALPYIYPLTISFAADGNQCKVPGFTQLLNWNFCAFPGTCYCRRNSSIWEGTRGICMSPCIASQCASKSGLNLRGTDKYCNPTGGGSFTCANYQPINSTCGGYDANLAPIAPLCDWQSVCLNSGSSWTCQRSSCLSSCEYGTYCYQTNTTADTAVCGGYEVPAFNDEQFEAYLAIYAGFQPGDSIQSRKQLMSAQTGKSLIGQLSCTPGTNDCGMLASCIPDPSSGNHYCFSPLTNACGLPTILPTIL